MMIRPRDRVVQLIRTEYVPKDRRGKQVLIGSFHRYTDKIEHVPEEIMGKLKAEEKAQLEDYFLEKQKHLDESASRSILRSLPDDVETVISVLISGPDEKVALLGDLAALDQKLINLRKVLRKHLPKPKPTLSSNERASPDSDEGEVGDDADDAPDPSWYVEHGGQPRLSDAGVGVLLELYKQGMTVIDAAQRMRISKEAVRKRFKEWQARDGELTPVD